MIDMLGTIYESLQKNEMDAMDEIYYSDDPIEQKINKLTNLIKNETKKEGDIGESVNKLVLLNSKLAKEIKELNAKLGRNVMYLGNKISLRYNETGRFENFIDKNKIFIGWGSGDRRYCGWYISDSINDSIEDIEEDKRKYLNYTFCDYCVFDYVFDITFFKKCSDRNVAFKLVNKNGNEKYLHLYSNYGCYRKNFVVKNGYDTTIMKDSI